MSYGINGGLGRPDSIIVTGNNGFFGRHIRAVLETAGYNVIVPPNDTDFTNKDIANAFLWRNPAKCIVCCAAKSGGIVWNQTHQKEAFGDNILISFNTFNAAIENPWIEKIINVVSSCAYQSTNKDLTEDMFFDGEPDESIKYFGLYKRATVTYAEVLQKKYPTKKFINAVFSNLYGPGDSLIAEKVKATGGIIKKILIAHKNNEPSVTLLGTGNPLRQPQFVVDAAYGIKNLIDTDNVPFLINVVDNEEYSIRQHAELISDIIGYNGDIIFDTNFQDGQMRKYLNGDLCRKTINYHQRTSFEEGLKQTIEYYKQTIQEESR